MTPSKIIEGNVLIAEFMQIEYESIYDLNYRCSWNWLMPVVKKCFYKADGSQRPNAMEEYAKIHESLILPCETATWLAVVDFVKWYNQQNPKP